MQFSHFGPFSGGGGNPNFVDKNFMDTQKFLILFRWKFSSRPESTKHRNRKSPRFSVANVPVAGQTEVGTFFSPKKFANRIAIASVFLFFARKDCKALLGARTLLGPRKSLRLCHLRQKIAITITEKSGHLVHSDPDSTLRQKQQFSL